ncbi:probable inactive receptor kinase At1g48480 [Euphorbia lathyris]|uniref:probable inactive receptor kinase At1g48480 n=1 Tax=Euphorbia lathyris TaxID=212925 RepID=UPI0033131F27
MKLFCFLSIIFLLSTSSIVHSDLAPDTTSLLALRAAIGGRFLLLWNISDETPCNWTGVTCQANRVVELRLPGMSLSGKLPVVIGNLTELRTLSLQFNDFSGPIPAEIGNLASLRNLYLQGNLFAGEIPEFLFNLQNLVRLNLGFNNFSGVISPNFNKLRRLATLCLDRNQLNGSIPDLNLGSLNKFNVSFNKLSGSIPERLSSNPVNSFEGNSLCGKPLLLCNGSSIGDNEKLSGGAIVGIVISCFIGCLCQKKRIKQGGVKDASEDLYQSEISMEEGVADVDIEEATTGSGEPRILRAAKHEGKSGVLEFNLEDLLRASAEVLGKGTVGTTYKASLEMGITMVVKRVKNFDFTENRFLEMVEGIEKINHENLFPLRAYYYSKDERLLVYDYMPMESLYGVLHENRGASRTSLNWDIRTDIALGAARAIAHLHSQDPSTSHGNIKSSNVLLTSTFEARVSDYGVVRFTDPVTPKRFDGYRAPEVTFTNEISQKADVYSYGVLFFELLTGKDPNGSHLKDERLDLPRWMLSAVNDEWTSEVFDVELLQYGNLEELMLQLLELAFNCTAQNPDNRPSMSEVISRIEMLCCSSSQIDETDVNVKKEESS